MSLCREPYRYARFLTIKGKLSTRMMGPARPVSLRKIAALYGVFIFGLSGMIGMEALSGVYLLESVPVSISRSGRV